MEQSEVMEGVVKILAPWVKNQDALASVGMKTNILEDLKVNSARLVDVVIGRPRASSGRSLQRFGRCLCPLDGPRLKGLRHTQRGDLDR